MSNNSHQAPQKTIERLIMYRTVLEKMSEQENKNIYSKQLAESAGNTAAQVRRDLMFVGYSGNPGNGYDVSTLIDCINNLLEPDDGIPMILIGIGNLGRAILGYFSSMKPKFSLIGAFDTDSNKINRVIAGCRCYHISEMNAILQGKDIQLGVITVPGNQAQNAADKLVEIGVNGIVDFSSVPLRVPLSVHLEKISMTMMFEKVAYFSRLNKAGGNCGN